MKKRTLINFIAVSLFIITYGIMVSSVFAQPMLPPQKWWNNPEVIKQLNLTESQQKTIDSLFNEKKNGFKNLIQETKKIENDLKNATEKNFDQSKAASLIDKLIENRSKMMKERLTMNVNILAVLTPEQREKVMQKKQEFMEKRKGMMKDRLKGGFGEDKNF